MEQFIKIRFNDIKDKAPSGPGIYEIYTIDEEALKVGIGANLRKRLLQHLSSRQKYLTLKPNGNWSNPAHVISKQSILAKYLYFEKQFKDYDLRTEDGRQRFLQEKCYIRFRVTSSRDEARALEKVMELEGHFRYVGKNTYSVTHNRL